MTEPQTIVAQDIIDNLKIPPQPEILNLVYSELSKDNPSQQVIADGISRDAGLYSAILRLINSPYFGLRAEVTSIPHAISLIGLENLAGNIACIKLRSEMENSGFSHMPRYWDSAYNLARLSCEISRQLGVGSPHEVYVLGMFKDCGVPVLRQHYQHYLDILKYQNTQDQEIFTAYEDQQLNTNHAVIGYLVMKQWGLKQSLREACLHHHDIPYIVDERFSADQQSRSLILIMKIARHIMLEWRSEPDYEWPRLMEFALFFMGMSEPDFLDLKDQMLDYLGMEGV